MRRLTCLYIFILIAGTAKAQIASTIIDGITGKALSKASISLQNIQDSVVNKTVAQDSGSFSFNNIPDGHYILTVSYIGYEDYNAGVEVLDHKTNALLDTIQLIKGEKNLSQVVVTGTKAFVEYNTNLITLNMAESPVAVNGSAYDVVKRAPGVIETLNGLSFRNRPTLILINGRPTYLTGSDLKQMLSDMPASNIDKIQIIPNPSAKYDANAQSVIDIKLAKNNNYGLNGTFTGAIGTGEQLRYDGGFSLNYRKNNINIYGNYSYGHNDQWYDMKSDRSLTATDDIRENNKEERIRYNNDYKLGVDYAISKNSEAGILFTGYTNFRSRNSMDSITLAHAAPVPDSFSTVGMNGHAIFSYGSINAYYKTTFDTSGKMLTFNADYFNYRKRWTDNYTTNYYTIDKVQYQPPYLLRDSSPGNNNVYSFAADYSNPVKNGRIDAGVKTTHTETNNNVLWQYQNGADWLVDTTQTNHFIYNENITAAYISCNKTFGKYEFILGLRGEETITRTNLVTKNEIHDSSYFGFFPNVLMQYSKNENNVFSIGYHKTVQRPNFDMINPFIVYISKYSFFAGNPYIKPEIDNTFSLTYMYKRKLNVTVNYVRAVNDITALVTTGANNSVGVISGNISKVDMFYFSANWGSTIHKFWNYNISGEAGYLNYNNNHQNGISNNGNDGFVYLGQLQNTFKFNNGWGAELNATYHSTIPSGVYVARPSFGSDAGVQKKVLHDKGKLTLSLTDIFNTEVMNYGTNFMGIDEKVHYKAESRFIKLQFTYKFGKKSVKQEIARPSAIADINKRMKS